MKRIVVVVSVLAAFAEGKSTVGEPECVRKSYPNFWEDYGKAGGLYEVER